MYGCGGVSIYDPLYGFHPTYCKIKTYGAGKFIAEQPPSRDFSSTRYRDRCNSAQADKMTMTTLMTLKEFPPLLADNEKTNEAAAQPVRKVGSGNLAALASVSFSHRRPMLEQTSDLSVTGCLLHGLGA